VRVRPGPLWLATLLLFALAGCRSTRPPPDRVGAVALPTDDPRPARLLEDLSRDARERLSLRGLARLSVDGPGGSGRAKQIVLLERPARLRVEVLGLLNQTIAVLTTDGAAYRLFRAEDRSWSDGEIRPSLLWEVAGIALSPAEAVAVLLGTPEPPAGAQFAGAAALREGGVRIELDAPGAAAAPVRLTLDFDARSRLRRFAYRNAAGVAWFEVRFGEYRDVAGLAFAHAIELFDRLNGTEAKVSFAEVELNPTLPPEVFALERGGTG
jgi:hypothetical protein